MLPAMEFTISSPFRIFRTQGSVPSEAHHLVIQQVQYFLCNVDVATLMLERGVV